MSSHILTRRQISVRLLALLPAVSALGNAQTKMEPASQPDANGVSRGCECIHQEVVIKAPSAAIYRVLTDGAEFKKVTELVLPKSSAAEISPEVGGAFSLFGGIIVGRHIEMVPGERLVQAWREKSWDPGVYSLVRFQLKDSGAETNLIFDHAGFPQGAADHLAIGWKSHYWEPLQKYLASHKS